eukprot:1161225-Pelagomonas_calceolata.AAC.8
MVLPIHIWGAALLKHALCFYLASLINGSFLPCMHRYVVYSQLVSACEALHEPCRASIEGDLAEGEAALRASTSGTRLEEAAVQAFPSVVHL